MGEIAYLQLMQEILTNGEERKGRNGITKSVFGERLVFDLKLGFPLLTTKRVFMRGVIEELLWFLRGSTDVTELQAKNVHIWDANSSRSFLDSVGLYDCSENTIGKAYGWQWRNFGGNDSIASDNVEGVDKCNGIDRGTPSMGVNPVETVMSACGRHNGFDQIEYVVYELKYNPTGRRAVLSAWNPQQLHEMALPPCHFAYMFYVGKKGLCCQMIMRSCDIGAGLPFNIASTALFTHILAYALHYDVDKIIIVTGDTHLYEQHYESAAQQIQREPMKPPKITFKIEPPNKTASIPEIIKWIENLKAEDIVLENYVHHSPITYEMIA